MRSRWLTLKDRITASFWFVPVLMVLGAMALVWLANLIDTLLVEPRSPWLSWIYSGNAEGAEAVLSAIAGSMITVAALVFSLVVVVLTLASSQFGPRILRNFMRDKVNQVVLGTFVATFLYSLLVLRQVRYGDLALAPHVAVTVAVGLSLCSLFVLIYFIHHIAQSIQAPQLVAAIADDLGHAVDRLYPERVGDEAEAAPPAPVPTAPAAVLAARRTGYLQAILGDDLLELAEQRQLVLELLPQPGDFVVAGQGLARVWPASALDDEPQADALQQAFVIGRERTHTQDVRFVSEQLVEVALRALSPGIHDPFTALNCIDQLGAGLRRLAQRRLPSPWRRGEDDAPRVLARPVTLAGLIEGALPPIARQAGTHLEVAEKLLQAIAKMGAVTRREADREALRRQAAYVHAACAPKFELAVDRERLQRALAAAQAELERRQ